MAEFGKDATGDVDDAVRIELGETVLLVAKDYQVDIAFLQVPNAFTIQIGSGSTALKLMKRYPMNTQFRLFIGPVCQFVGRTDGFDRGPSAATDISIVGRDILGRMLKKRFPADRKFLNDTYEQLTIAAIKGAGLAPYTLTVDDAAQRSATTGTPIVEQVTIEKDADLNTLFAIDSAGLTKGVDLNFAPLDVVPPKIKIVENRFKGYKNDHPIEAKLGESYYEWLKKQLEKAGLFIRAGIDVEGLEENVFLVSEPHARQSPLYALYNRRGKKGENHTENNVKSVDFKDHSTSRYAKYIFVGLGGRGKDGRKEVRGEYVDMEMREMGYDEEYPVNDKSCKSTEHANFLARKMCAEARRSGKSITYTIKGHTLPLLLAPSRRAVVAIDTCIQIFDEENGVEGIFWIERVRHKGSANNGRVTEITVMDPDDLVFGDGGFQRGIKQKNKMFGRRRKQIEQPAVEDPTALVDTTATVGTDVGALDELP
jgi:hypothetical protein